MLTVLVVVAHLGFGLARSGTGSVNGLFDDLHVRLVGGTRSRGVDGVLVNGGASLEAGAGDRGVDGELVNGGVGLEGRRAEAGTVDGRAGYRELLAVVGLDAGTVLALSNVDDGVVRAVGGIVLDTRLGVGGLRADEPKKGCVSGGWEGKRGREGRKRREPRVFLPSPGPRRLVNNNPTP